MAYDANGNTTQKGSQQFSYNFRNQLVRSIDGGSTIMLKYDPLGRRIEKIGSGNTIKFYYVGSQVIEERNGSDLVLKQYIYGNGIDELLRLDVYSGATSTPYYVHTNDIGSTTAITDANGALVERVSYDTFGLPSFSDASGQPIASSSIGNNILFQGREYDFELNLYNYRARYYDPIMGRFLQTDPVGYQDSMNLYQGMNMNPGNFLDPLGEWATKVANVHAILIRHALIQRRFINLENAYFKGHYDQQFYDEINNKIKAAGSVSILMLLLGLTNKDVETIATEDKAFDNETQSDDMQYVHSMRGNEKETIAEAHQKRTDFKKTTLNAIRAHRINRKQSGDMRYWDEVELQLFAQLEHPFVDETCPTHNWQVFKKNLSAVPHTFGDFSPTSSDLFENAKILWRLLIEASSDNDDLSDLPSVLVQMYNYLKNVSKQE
jgi:RHS repeat-associated protein